MGKWRRDYHRKSKVRRTTKWQYRSLLKERSYQPIQSWCRCTFQCLTLRYRNNEQNRKFRCQQMCQSRKDRTSNTLYSMYNNNYRTNLNQYQLYSTTQTSQEIPRPLTIHKQETYDQYKSNAHKLCPQYKCQQWKDKWYKLSCTLQRKSTPR